MNQSIRKYKALIVDDNEIDRLSTLMYLKPYGFIVPTGVYESAEAAQDAIKSPDIDVLFLDIDMPGISGLELRRSTGNEKVCIFITSYPDYAVEGFELAALDFLVKPLSQDRFAQAMQRLFDYLEVREKASLFSASIGGDAIFIKEGHNQVKVLLHEIQYLEALRDYTRIVTASRKYCVLSTLGNLLQEKAFNPFLRIHRSYAVQKHFVRKYNSKEVMLDTITLPVGRSFKDVITASIGNI